MKEVQVIRPTIGEEAGKLLRVAAYCRVSTDSDDQINSFIAQVKYYNDFIRRSENMTLVDIYADEGITGTCVNKRDEFLRMMSDSKKGKIDRVLVKSVSRFARNSLECIENIRLLKSYGTTVLFENDGIDTEKMNSEMILYIKSAFAQNEALATSKRVSTAARMRFQQGDCSVYTVPVGFTSENGVLIPIPEYIPVIERIFREYLSGKGAGRIVEELNAENCMDKHWTITGIKYILSNEKYIGDCLWQKNYTPAQLPLKRRRNHGEVDKYYISNTHEPMIDKELFYAVQRKLERNKTAFGDRKQFERSVFTGLIKCGDCGCIYKRKETQSGTYWICSKTGVAGRQCKTHNTRENDIKQAFVRLFNRLKKYEDETVSYLLNQIVALKAKISSQSSAIGEIDTEIATLCDKNSMLTKLKARNIIDDVSYFEQTSEIQRKLTDLRRRRIKLLNDDEDEACIEQIRILKKVIDEQQDYLIRFNEDIFNSIIDNITILDTDEALFHLKCGLNLKEKIQ